MKLAITGTDVEMAAGRIAGRVHRTPVLTSRLFDEVAGASCFFKCENFQRGGAFKIRGATNFLQAMSPEELRRGVVAFSSGNHAQALAIAARDAGTTATIVMPSDAPRLKVEATRAYGANITMFDRLREDREAIGRRIAEETGAALVPPFDHPWIMAGQGTLALELLKDTGPLDALAICIGGGGLISGCAVAAKHAQPEIRVFGVEPELANDTWLSRRKGERVEIPPPGTIADGLRAPKPGALTFPVVQDLVEEIFLVTEQEISDAMEFLRTRLKIVAEPSGAVAAAAALHRKLPAKIERLGIVISGGNV
jgi:threonine dehydratase